MAISTGYSTLRRTLAQRLNYWGGDISNNGPGIFTGVGTLNTAIDNTRSEPDDEWDSAWIVLNPGSTDQTNAPTIWRRIADTAGWISATGTLTIFGSWPAPYNNPGPGYTTGTSTSVNSTTLTDNTATWTTNQWAGHTITRDGTSGIVQSNTANICTLTSAGWSSGTPANGTYTITMPYELYKVFRPENWLQAINWAIVRSYPKRHVAVSFEVPLDNETRIIRWGDIVDNLALPNPTTAPVVTEVANGNGTYQPGTYTFGYTLYNDIGETLVSTTSSLVVSGTNSQVRFAAISPVPDQAFGAIYYSSQIPNNTQMGSLSIGEAILDANPPTGTMPGVMLNGVLPAVTFSRSFVGPGVYPPIYNTTNLDVQELHHILLRVNPGNYPELWNDLGSDLYKPLGGKTIMLNFLPLSGRNLRFVCSASSPTLKVESDVTDEPPEMLYSGGEHYLWNLLVKTSTIVNVNWAQLAKDALDKYEALKNDYSLDVPRTIAFRPPIQVQY